MIWVLLIAVVICIVYFMQNKNSRDSTSHQNQGSNTTNKNLYVPSSIRDLNMPDDHRTFLMTIEWWIAVYEEMATRTEEAFELQLHCEANATYKNHSTYALNPNCDSVIKYIPGMKRLTDPNHNSWVELGRPEYDGDDPILYNMAIENLVNLIKSYAKTGKVTYQDKSYTSFDQEHIWWDITIIWNQP